MFINLKDYSVSDPEKVQFIQEDGFPYTGMLNRILITKTGETTYCFTEEGNLVYESFLHDRAAEKTLNPEMEIGEITKLSGEYALLSGSWTNNFFHWIIEYLPKVIILERNNFNGIYLVDNYSGFIKESLDLLGISESRIQKIEDKSYFAEKIWFTEKYGGEYKLKFFPNLINKIRNKFLSKVKFNDEKRKILILRKKVNRGTNIVNEKELVDLVSKYGFEPVYMEDFSLREQIEIMANSEAVIGPHGAGFVHTLFMKEKSLVLELFSPNYIPPCMLPVIDYLKHRYFMIPGETSIYSPYEHGQDINAFIEMIRITLEREL